MIEFQLILVFNFIDVVNLLVKRKKTVLILFILVTLVLSASSFAADEEIDLDPAFNDFYTNNYDILINKYEIDKAYADFIGAKLIPNPTFTLNYTGVEIRKLPQAGDNTQLATRIDQLIELGGKRGLRTAAADEALEATKLAHKDTIRSLLVGFYTLFYNLNLDMLNIDSARDELKRFDRTLEIAEKRYSAGFLTLVDYTKLKVGRIDLENSLITVETQFKNDIETFNLLIGSKKALRPIRMQLQENFPEYTELTLINAAYQNRYDLLSLQRQLKASEHNIALSKSLRIPDITVGAEYDSFGAQNRPAFGVGFSLNIPIFNWGQSEVAKTTAGHHQIEIQIEKAKRQIVLDIRQAINNYDASLKIFGAYKNRKGDLDDLMSRSEKAFSLGGITVLDLLDTEKTHRDFISKYNQAFVQSNLNKELLKVYTGEIK